MRAQSSKLISELQGQERARELIQLDSDIHAEEANLCNMSRIGLCKKEEKISIGSLLIMQP